MVDIFGFHETKTMASVVLLGHKQYTNQIKYIVPLHITLLHNLVINKGHLKALLIMSLNSA
jgi:hypothetical protein